MATVIKELDGFVAVGTSGESYYSTDGINWTKISGLNTSSTYHGIAYGDGRFVAVGTSGKTYYSTDGINWTEMTGMTNTYTYYGVTYGNGRFVCVGGKGYSYYSLDGQTWVAMSGLNTSYQYNAVTYGNGRFVCVGGKGYSYYSLDGQTWVAMSGLYSTSYFGVAYGNGRFVCVGNGISYYSTDGETWIAMSGLNTGKVYRGVTYGNDRFVCVSENGYSYYSLDGQTWVAMSGLNTSYDYYGVAYGNGRFVCVGTNGQSYYSLDGQTWVAMSGLANHYYYGVTSGIIKVEVEIHPQIILGTNKPNILKLGATDLIKAYLGTNLVYQKITEQKHTDNPIPTTWTEIATNSYTSGDWAIRSTTPRGDQTVDLAFDGDLTTSSNYSAATSYVYLTPPTNLKISKMKLDVQLKYGALTAICKLQVSTDNGSTWNDLMDISNTDHVLTEFELPSFDYGQIYRLYLGRSSTNGYLRIYEWQISEYYTNS